MIDRGRALLSLLCASLPLVACGERKPPPNPRGIWLYGVSEADTRPVSGATITTGSPSAPAAAAPAPSVPSAAPAPRAPTPAAPRAAPASTGYQVAPVEGGGTIRALCRLTAPAHLAPLSIFKDNDKGCGAKEHPSERAVFDAATLGLGGCVVSIRRIESGKAWSGAFQPEERSFVLDQKHCVYVPHVGVVRTSTQMVVVNSDRADHNIHAFRLTLADTMFNFASEPGTTKDVQEAFIERPGAYPMKCDIHPWMSAYVLAFAHPYFDLTSAQGDATRKPGEAVLADVPPGDYEVECWHEGMTETPQFQDGRIAAYTYSPAFVEVLKVTVAPKAEVRLEFSIPPK